MRIGIDSYSYHRLLGEVRPGERDPGERLPGARALIAEMLDAGAEVLSLETVFLPAPGAVDAAELVDAAAGREIVPAWGHPVGLRWGARADLLDELLAWIALAPGLGARSVRCVAAGPALAAAPRAERVAATAAALRHAVAAAREAGAVLALENHADVDREELEELLDRVPGLMVCLDTANALRVGDDPVALARAVAGRIAMVHLKDVAGGPADPMVGPRSVPHGEGVVDLHGVLAAVAPDPVLPVCVELGHLGGGDVDERRLVRDGVAWLRRASTRGRKYGA
jgi:sugar phosphate isomerase/epimerase